MIVARCPTHKIRRMIGTRASTKSRSVSLTMKLIFVYAFLFSGHCKTNNPLEGTKLRILPFEVSSVHLLFEEKANNFQKVVTKSR